MLQSPLDHLHPSESDHGTADIHTFPCTGPSPRQSWTRLPCPTSSNTPPLTFVVKAGFRFLRLLLSLPLTPRPGCVRRWNGCLAAIREIFACAQTCCELRCATHLRSDNETW